MTAGVYQTDVSTGRVRYEGSCGYITGFGVKVNEYQCGKCGKMHRVISGRPSPPETVSQAAERMYPGVTFDTALPQPWVNEMADLDMDVRGNVVWGYPENSTFGFPLPVTTDGALMVYSAYCQHLGRLRQLEDVTV